MKPFWIFFSLWLAVPLFPAHAFNREYHCEIIDSALHHEGFDPGALELIYFANRSVDKAEFNNHEAHFDSEKFADGSKRLKKLLDETLKALEEKRYRDAQVFLGRSLHSIQDFFSHSNYVELSEPKSSLDFLNLEDPKAEVVCNYEEKSFTDLSSGYYPDDQTPEGKCSHEELNKDDETKAELHALAKKKALEQSEAWIKFVLNQLKEKLADDAKWAEISAEFKKVHGKVASESDKTLKCDELVKLPQNALDDATLEQKNADDAVL